MKKDFIWPEITSETESAVVKQLHDTISIYDNSGIIGELESALSKYLRAKHTVLFNSGTSALHALYMSANLREGDEVICPAYTFFATVTPLLFTGAIPILADCNSEGNIDPKEIRKKITGKTKAVMITHMWGLPCDMDEIVAICKEHNLLLFEDISHAFGATYNGKHVGTFGNIAACSLQGQKVLTGGEGGFIVTNNDEMFHRSLLFGHYNKRCKNEIPKDSGLSEFATTGMGLKLRIHPLAAAIAKQQLTNVGKILANRSRYAEMIADELKNLKNIEVIFPPRHKTSSWYAFIIKYNGKEPLEKIHQELLSHGLNEIDIPNSTSPLNLLPLFQKPEKLFPNYAGRLNYKEGDFPVAEKFSSAILKIPVWSNDEDELTVMKYIDIIKEVFTKYE